MKKLITIAIVTATMLGSIQAEEEAPTGLRGSINRTWEAGKVVLGALLLIPGCACSADGAFKLRAFYKNPPPPDSWDALWAGGKLGTGLGSLPIGIALMESGFRNLREARKHKR